MMWETAKNVTWAAGVLGAIIGSAWTFVVEPALAGSVKTQIDAQVNERIEDLEGGVGQLKLKTNDTKLKIIELQAEQRVLNVKVDQVLELLKSRLAPTPDGE